MQGAKDLSLFSMIMCIFLLLLPLIITNYLKLNITKKVLQSASRMIIQLFSVGIFLEYIFKWNNFLLNALWFLIMIATASFSVVKNSKLNIRHFFTPILFAFILSNLLIVLYFNYFIVRLTYLFDAKYIIAIGGMLLGNSLRANIVGIGDFYTSIKKDENLFFYYLSLGASKKEAIMPFLKKSFKSALNPTIASMATMGIVSLPGMMTGQILGGSVPLVAIKYQIAIMIAIFASTVFSITFSLYITIRKSFDKYGILKKELIH